MLKKTAMFGLMSLVAALFLASAGCQSTGSGSTTAAETKAIMCDKCKTVFISNPAAAQRFSFYSPAKAMSCPDCKSAVANYFATGKLEHTCKTCGGDLQPCEFHD